METYIGFDSAWTDNPKAPGAICALQVRPDQAPLFHRPKLAGFADALTFVAELATGSDYILMALDQPTIVPNPSSMRPAERVAASVISWVGGGVQPANRGRIGMFCDAAPIWRFLAALGAVDDPVRARQSRSGRYVMEVFPALALASLDPAFGRRLGAPKYNPANRRKFRLAHWRQVCATAAAVFDAFALDAPTSWCRDAMEYPMPGKADQDRLDAMLCLAAALIWRRGKPDESIMIGDLDRGYIVAPVSAAIRDRLATAAARGGVSIDGVP